MLHVHRAERADHLVDALCALLADPLPDPFAREVLSVPTRGIERWLTQRLSTGLGAQPGRSDGVCANVDFPTPHRLVADAVATASDIDPDSDPWRPERSVWPLLEVVQANRAEPWLRELARHIADEQRRYPALRHLADLFDRYALHRPDMVRAWGRGEGDHWQAELWRRLRAAIGTLGPAERVERACERLAADPGIVDLPRRLSLFGLTRLPAGHLGVLRAIAARRDVHLFLLHPSPALWEQIDALEPRVVRRRDDPTASLPMNPLLASWGRDARELQLVIAGDHADHHHAPDDAARDHAARPRPGRRPRRPRAHGSRASTRATAASRSTRCHGRARQVEVLRDAILHLLAGRPDARAARRDRDVPGHRAVRAADPGDVRRRRGRRGRRRPAPG